MSTQTAFFLIADDRAIATPWRDRILTMFSLIQQHAKPYQTERSSNRYADAVEKAFSNLPGLASSQRRIAAADYDTIASGIKTLLASAPAAQVEKQLAFLKQQGMLDAKDATITPIPTPYADPPTSDASLGTSISRQFPYRFSAGLGGAASLPASSVLIRRPNEETLKPPSEPDETSDAVQATPISWTFYVGTMPRIARDTPAAPSIWIGFARWEPLHTPLPDIPETQDALNEAKTKARTETGAPQTEHLACSGPTRVQRDAGRLHTRVLEATLHDTFFNRYAERWSKFTAKAPADRIRDDPGYLFIPVKHSASA